jgi:nitrogen fixation protein NifU and related proteins
MSDAPYLALVVEHYRRPRNCRSLAAATHRHEGANPLCGDRLRMEAEVRGGVLTDIGFQASACAIATASASLLTERLRGATLREVEALGEDEVVGALGAGVPTPRRGCATLALRVLRDALAGAPG